MRNRVLLFAAVCGGPFVVGEVGGQQVARAPGLATQITQEDLEWVEIVPGVDFAAVQGQWAEGAHAKFARFASHMSNEPCLIFTYGDAPWDVEMVED